MKGGDIRSTKSVNFRVKEELKTNAEALLSEMGLTMSSALNLFLKQRVNKRALPFTVEAADPFYSKINQESFVNRLKKYEQDEKIKDPTIELMQLGTQYKDK